MSNREWDPITHCWCPVCGTEVQSEMYQTAAPEGETIHSTEYLCPCCDCRFRFEWSDNYKIYAEIEADKLTDWNEICTNQTTVLKQGDGNEATCT